MPTHHGLAVGLFTDLPDASSVGVCMLDITHIDAPPSVENLLSDLSLRRTPSRSFQSSRPTLGNASVYQGVKSVNILGIWAVGPMITIIWSP